MLSLDGIEYTVKTPEENASDLVSFINDYCRSHGIKNSLGEDVYIEAKGIENDVFYIKKKLFRKYLDDWFIKTNQSSIYFEIYTKKQLLQAIEIIKKYEPTLSKDSTESTVSTT